MKPIKHQMLLLEDKVVLTLSVQMAKLQGAKKEKARLAYQPLDAKDTCVIAVPEASEEPVEGTSQLLFRFGPD